MNYRSQFGCDCSAGLSHQNKRGDIIADKKGAAMSESPFSSLEECFGDLPDPRVQGRCDHKLIDLVAVCAVLCGAESWSEVEEFGQAKETWLKQYLDLPAGIPSHDTFSRVFRLLDAGEFQRRFMIWVEQHFSIPRGQVIAVDGKTARGSHDHFSGQEALQLVSNSIPRLPFLTTGFLTTGKGALCLSAMVDKSLLFTYRLRRRRTGCEVRALARS